MNLSHNSTAADSFLMCRCALVLLKLGRTQEAVLRLTHVLDLYRWRDLDYRNDKLIVRTMADCHYLSAAKQRSVNWPNVQFKDNCYVVDPLGAGDYISLSVCLSSVEKPVLSILSFARYRHGADGTTESESSLCKPNVIVAVSHDMQAEVQNSENC